MRTLLEGERPPYIFSPVDPSHASIGDIDDKLELESLLKPLKLGRGSRNVAILMDRSGLDVTLEEVGQIYGISRERVRQIYSEGLEIVRRALVVRGVIAINRSNRRVGEIDAQEAAIRTSMLIPQVKKIK